MIAFVCRTPYHVFRTIQMKMELYPNCDAEAFIIDTFKNAEEISHSLTECGIFKRVFYIKESENVKRGKAESLRSLYFDSYFNRSLCGKKYDEIFLFNIYATTNDIAVNKVKKENPSCLINMVEDGPSIYYIERIVGPVQRYIYPLLKLYVPIKCIDYWWFSEPEKMHPFGDGKKRELPKINKNRRDIVNCLNFVFDYKDNVVIRDANLIFMEECYWNDGLLKSNKDLELFRRIKSQFPQIRTCVKMHPRTKVNRFAEYFDVVEPDGKPWELYALNMNMSNKILVSLSCGTMISTRLLYSEETYSLLLYPLLINDIREANSGNIYLTEDRISQIESQKEMYEDPSKFSIAASEEQAYSLIEGWLSEISSKGE